MLVGAGDADDVDGPMFSKTLFLRYVSRYQ